MKLELKFYLCTTEIFAINDIEADYRDFGEKYDHAPWLADEFGCGDMRFDSNLSTQNVLNKYGITASEYDIICDKLSVGFNIGCCGMCI